MWCEHIGVGTPASLTSVEAAVPVVLTQGVTIKTMSGLREWLCPSIRNVRVNMAELQKLMVHQFPSTDLDELDDMCIEWFGGPSEGTLPKDVDAARVLGKVRDLFEF